MTAARPEGLTLPEELLLLALEPSRGTAVGPRQPLRYGLAAAALAELELAGRVAEHHGRLTGSRAAVVNSQPLGNQLLDAALSTLSPEGTPAQRWVRQAGVDMEDMCWTLLRRRGAVRIEARRALGIIPVTRHSAGSTDLATPARARLRTGLRDGLSDPRDIALAALVSATGLDAWLCAGGPLSRERRDLGRLARETWYADTVIRAVKQSKRSPLSPGWTTSPTSSDGD
ncbi:GPP34 family phosphoprotein [Streptomyces sp. A7024]|uniref:GPP34 family phosphoprotein n=2 Tax=Streptomyces coryli TaxID=1128680 RepID=A0A6G4U0W7_9ACTN|nr:GPP34 family phosphoprotein [Streptomyces coryli]NGN65909.1 GPP34 family phosphoprotein [Streptomyces coryli]